MLPKKALFCNTIGESLYFLVKEIDPNNPNELYHVFPGVVFYLGELVKGTEHEYILDYSRAMKYKKKIKLFTGTRVFKSI